MRLSRMEQAAVGVCRARLEELQQGGDPEHNHAEADKAMEQLLRARGLPDLAQLHSNAAEWFA